MAENFTLKEIAIMLMEKLDAVDQKQSEHISYTTAKLEAIEAQTLKTNGRVSKNEEEIHALQVKHENMTVKVGVGVFVASTALAFLFNKVL